jgi:hypothetical protein
MDRWIPVQPLAGLVVVGVHAADLPITSGPFQPTMVKGPNQSGLATGKDIMGMMILLAFQNPRAYDIDGQAQTRDDNGLIELNRQGDE